MNSAGYREFVDADYTKFRRGLLRTKGGRRQRDFLRTVRDNKDFLNLLRDGITTVGLREPPLFPECMTEHEFKHPPASTETELYKAWENLTPRIACRTTFWASVTCRHIEENKIQAVYLAANGGPNISAAERIDRVLQGNGDNRAKRIDDCVRTVLRRFGGLPEVRGNRSVYVDCPLARAWWRERLVAEISQGDRHRADSVRTVIRITQTYWEELVTLVVSRNSVLGSHEVRNAFILSLADLLTNEPETPLRIGKNLRLACRNIGVIQASRELGVLDEDEIHALMDSIVKIQHQQALKRSADSEQSSALEPGTDTT